MNGRGLNLKNASLFSLSLFAIAMAGCGNNGIGAGGGNGTSDDPPIANAGASQTLVVDQGAAIDITLDGSASLSESAAIVQYVWTDENGNELATGVQATVTLGTGEHVVTLTVTDEDGRTDSSSVTITILDSSTLVTLTIDVVGGGTTTPEPGMITYNAGDRVTLDAAPDDGWQFAKWSGDLDTTLASTSIFMDGDKSITAEFTPVSAGDLPLFHAPFAPGTSYVVTQGNGGDFSHADKFAWDFNLPLDTPVVAPAAGRIVYVVEDLPNNGAGSDPHPDDPANVVVMDLGNGLSALFAHLDLGGVKPQPGQLIAQGQCIALSGNSGYSTGPHLHYEVLNANQVSVPTGLIESSSPSGVAEEGETVVSQNELSLNSVEEYQESTLPVDAFAENSVALFEPTPPAYFYETGTPYTISGRTLDGANAVCIAIVEFDGQATSVCEDTIALVQPNGEFSLEFTLPDGLSGPHLLGVISGSFGVTGVASVPIHISASLPPNTPPSAVTAQPNDRTLRVGNIGTLDGSDSFDEDGDLLTYQWVQVSGPPVTLTNANAAETAFTLTDTEGNQRLLFQLTVSDGIETSLPAAVEFEIVD